MANDYTASPQEESNDLLETKDYPYKYVHYTDNADEKVWDITTHLIPPLTFTPPLDSPQAIPRKANRPAVPHMVF